MTTCNKLCEQCSRQRQGQGQRPQGRSDLAMFGGRAKRPGGPSAVRREWREVGDVDGDMPGGRRYARPSMCKALAALKELRVYSKSGGGL